MTSSRAHSLRQRWEAQSQRPFFRLTRLFADRIFRGGGEADGDDLGFSLGLVLALLALPGAFYSIFLFDKYSSLLQWIRGQHNFDPLAAALPDEYFFIVLSMVVTGTVAVWRWDSIFPDRRDYANLVPLPISTRIIFLANLAAIVFLTLVLAFDVNAASAVLFPVVVSGSQQALGYVAQFAAIHALVIVLASIFSFFAVFATVGVLIFALPYAVFRRISLYVRGLIIVCLLTLLSTSFAVPSLVDRLPRTPHSPIRLLPSVWFLGFCQLLRGKADPSLAVLGRMAVLGSLCVILVAIAAYALSYRRCFTRIPENMDITEETSRGYSSWLFSVLDRTVLRSPFQRAGYRFVMRTLLRSERHSLVLGGFFALGIVIASQVLFVTFNDKIDDTGRVPSAALLSIPFILSYCILVGLRFVFDIPTELRANWIFRLSLDKTGHECIPLARKILLTFNLPWVFAAVFPVSAYLWGWTAALLHSALITIWSALLAGILLVRFRKVPFTCSYPPFRDSAIVVVLCYILGFFAFVVLTSRFEYWALLDPALMLLFVPIIFGTWYALHRLQQEAADSDKQLIFEEKQPVAFEVLDLGQWS
ncbi:MAG: hypothetical protein WCA20_15195 [Candidatus Sulfotelmatobacter sp.]